MIECLMAACHTKGVSNYRCVECGELKIFVCEGCEVELLNDLKSIGKIAVICGSCVKVKKPPSDRVKEIKVTPLLKNAEKFRQALIDTQQFEQSVVVRDLIALVKEAHLGK